MLILPDAPARRSATGPEDVRAPADPAGSGRAPAGKAPGDLAAGGGGCRHPAGVAGWLGDVALPFAGSQRRQCQAKPGCLPVGGSRVARTVGAPCPVNRPARSHRDRPCRRRAPAAPGRKRRSRRRVAGSRLPRPASAFRARPARTNRSADVVLARDVEASGQRLRIVTEGSSGHVPTAPEPGIRRIPHGIDAPGPTSVCAPVREMHAR